MNQQTQPAVPFFERLSSSRAPRTPSEPPIGDATRTTWDTTTLAVAA